MNNGLARAQGAFFVASGLWPIVSLRSFERVTGPKPEGWLVKSMGGMIAAVGGTLLAGARIDPRSRLLATLGAGSALVLGLSDVVYVAKRRISPIYLLDAAIQLGIVAAWAGQATRSAPSN